MDRVEDETARIRELLALDKTTLPPDGGPRFNRLIFEASPYLLQHAENPVAWYPWGDAAFDAARRDGKPVLLSIGYATCHWCHVMAHESFEDPTVAAVINRHFVSVKVDREERPDIDDQYMLVSQMMTGSGGWPLNVIMTPEREPFFAVTYLPKSPRMGMRGIVEILENIAALWRTRPDLIRKNCSAVLEGLAHQAAHGGTTGSGEGSCDAARDQLQRMYDPECGGFGTAPKFPMPHYLSFLLLQGVRHEDTSAVAMATHSLEMMRRGGICDQVGFGFHRYAVDRQWLVPHFEKMLYDQALIADACLDAHRVTGEERFLVMAGEILAFVAADLTSPEGGFWAALDADSEGEEGRCYLWSPDEIRTVLGPEEGDQCCRLFDVTSRGNFEGRNILHLGRSPEEFAVAEGLPSGELSARLDRWRRLLREFRDTRVQPLRDEKILTSWNGLMIATLARAYAVTGTDTYRAAACRGAEFILTSLVTTEGRLLRSRHGGHPGSPGFLEDYSFFVRGLIELHQATLDPRFLGEALRLTGDMLRLFADPEGGGLFDTGSDAETPLLRMKGVNDGVIPSGNGVAAGNLLRLAAITGDGELARRGEAILGAPGGELARVPVNHLRFLETAELYREAVMTMEWRGDRNSGEFREMLREVHRRYLPEMIHRYRDDGSVIPEASLCGRGACHPPVSGIADLKRLLDTLR